MKYRLSNSLSFMQNSPNESKAVTILSLRDVHLFDESFKVILIQPIQSNQSPDYVNKCRGIRDVIHGTCTYQNASQNIAKMKKKRGRGPFLNDQKKIGDQKKECTKPTKYVKDKFEVGLVHRIIVISYLVIQRLTVLYLPSNTTL